MAMTAATALYGSPLYYVTSTDSRGVPDDCNIIYVSKLEGVVGDGRYLLFSHDSSRRSS